MNQGGEGKSGRWRVKTGVWPMHSQPRRQGRPGKPGRRVGRKKREMCGGEVRYAAKKMPDTRARLIRKGFYIEKNIIMKTEFFTICLLE